MLSQMNLSKPPYSKLGTKKVFFGIRLRLGKTGMINWVVMYIRYNRKLTAILLLHH